MFTRLVIGFLCLFFAACDDTKRIENNKEVSQDEPKVLESSNVSNRKSHIKTRKSSQQKKKKKRKKRKNRPLEKSASKPGTKPLSAGVGFANPGNNCFANAALKLLLALPRDHRLFDFLENPKNELQEAFTELIEKVEAKNSDVLSFITTILTQASYLDSFDDGQQHDSNDFLQAVLENIGPDFSFFQTYQRLEGNGSGKEFARNTPAEGVKIFPLEIPNPRSPQPLTLQQVVDATFIPEIMTGENQITDDNDNKCDGKRTMFWKLNKDETEAPEFVLFQLKRRITQGDASSKVKRQVSFEHGVALDFEGATAAAFYQVKAAIVHHGSAFGGHYVTFVKDGDRWILHNDSQVNVVNEERAKADIQEGGVLFYLAKSKITLPY